MSITRLTFKATVHHDDQDYEMDVVADVVPPEPAAGFPTERIEIASVTVPHVMGGSDDITDEACDSRSVLAQLHDAAERELDRVRGAAPRDHGRRCPVSKPTHTPAPWKAATGGVDGDEPLRWVVVTDGDPEYFIAEIQNGEPGDTMATEEANARLFAAGPEMLATLREWDEFADALSLVMAERLIPLWDLLPSKFGGIGGRIKAAIAKAEGHECAAPAPDADAAGGGK